VNFWLLTSLAARCDIMLLRLFWRGMKIPIIRSYWRLGVNLGSYNC
jgi:hypothetical protein